MGTTTYLSVVLYIKQQVCVGVCVDKTASNFCIHDLAYGYATRMRTAYYPQQQVSLVSTCDANICTWFASFVIAKGVHKRFQWTNAIADTASSFFFSFLLETQLHFSQSHGQMSPTQITACSKRENYTIIAWQTFLPVTKSSSTEEEKSPKDGVRYSAGNCLAYCKVINWLIHIFIIWQASRAAKMNQIPRCDWLPKRARWSDTARSGLS